MEHALEARSEALPGLSPEQVERIRKHLEAAHAPATITGYLSAWKQFCAWIEPAGIDALAASPERVAAYLAERAETRSVASVRHSAAAIAYVHKAAAQPNPVENEGVRRTLRGIARNAAREGNAAPKQAAALTSEAASAIWATAHLPRTGPTGRTETEAQALRRGNVDIALCYVMRDCLLRRSEAAALQWADVEFCADGSGRVHVRRSKTDQEGSGSVQFIAPASVRALLRIRPDTPQGSVFGLSARTISRRIRAAAQAAGLEGAFSGHSARVGMARDLAASGAELPALMQAGRWKSERMPALYTRNEAAGRGAVARYYGQA